ncbi:MAG: hypothetical protein JST80_05245 [Bdellovibrionales bacterium]|nr:hypothetical protein [Bdellovibrionales bacterium]
MYELLVRLMLIAAVAELGLNISEIRDCHSRECLARIEHCVRDVLRVHWKPISVFPEEARRFH